MALKDCLEELVEKGQLSAAQVREILDDIDIKKQEYLRRMGPELAQRQAEHEASRLLRKNADREKYLASLRIQATDRITQNMRQHPGGLTDAAILHVNGNRPSTFMNVESLERSVRGRLHSMWAEGIEQLRPRLLGLQRHKGLQHKILRELFNDSTGDKTAAAIARAWSQTAEYARHRFNMAGGDIAKREDWGLPQTHSMGRVASVSKEEWIEFTLPKLDRQKMIDEVTGRPIKDRDMVSLLSDIYEQITTDGMINLMPGRVGRRALANRHLDQRFLVFKSAQAWRHYQERFGVGDMYSTMTHHLDAMASEIARLEVLGPNPDAMVRYMSDLVKREAAMQGKPTPGLRLKFFEDSYKVASKKINVPVSDPIANFMSGTRNLLTSIQLGAAFLSALSDIGWNRITRGLNGLPQTGILKGIIRNMNPLDKEGRIRATRLGLIAENATMMALAQQRYLGEIQGPVITQLFSDAVLKASLLSPWTQAGRWAFGAEYLSFLGRHVKDKKPWILLPEGMRRNMAKYGITEDDWTKIAAGELYEEKGVPFVWPVRLMEKEDAAEAAIKLHRLVLQETELAVPSVNYATRAVLTQGTQPGSLIGEIARSVAMYKAFPVTVMNVHVLPAIRNIGNDNGRQLAELFITATFFGVLAYQAKQIQRGKDPINMDPRTEEGRRVWIAGAMQGGGLGLFGDFLFADTSRFGKSPSLTFAGPVAGLVDDVFKLSLGNIHQLTAGETTNFGREAVKFAGRYTPGGSLWYARLMYERLILDQLQMKVDPRARQSFNAVERRAKNDFNQRYWWRPGRARPSRSADIEQLYGGD